MIPARRTLEKLKSVSKIKNTMPENCVFDCQCGRGGFEKVVDGFDQREKLSYDLNSVCKTRTYSLVH